MSCDGGHLGFPIGIKNRNLVKDIPMIIPLQIFEISANQSILLALAAILNIRLELCRGPYKEHSC
jgi:hypothetical protein